MQDAEDNSSPGGSSVEALSSGLRSAVRQLGSSYRMGSAAPPDILSRTPSRRRGAYRQDAVGAEIIQETERRSSAEQNASSSRDFYELSDSKGVCCSTHICAAEAHAKAIHTTFRFWQACQSHSYMSCEIQVIDAISIVRQGVWLMS